MGSDDRETSTEEADPLDAFANDIIGTYDLSGARLLPISETENKVYRVETEHGDRYVLRIHRPEAKSLIEIQSEMEWLSALRRDTDIVAPEPVATTNGEWVATAQRLEEARPRHCVLFRWVEGELVGENPDAGKFSRMGGLMAKLHRHARRFRPSEGFYRGDPNGYQFDDDAISPTLLREDTYLRPGDLDHMREALALIRDHMRELGRSADVFGLIHGDLHLFNCLYFEGDVRPIDFDDCGWGHFLYDMAVSLLMIQDREDCDALTRSFLEGYRRVEPFDPDLERYLETFNVARRFIDLPWLLENMHNPLLADWARTYIPSSLEALRKFVESKPIR